MARGLNKVMLIGNLGADPETRYGQSGNAVTKCRIATSEQWRDKQTGEQQERTEWHSLVFFGRLAEVAAEYLKKGSKVYVEGQLRTSSWEDQQSGQKRYRTEIMVRDLQMLDSKPGGWNPDQYADQPTAQRDNGANAYREASGGRSSYTPSQEQSTAAATLPEDDFDDDIPF